MDNYLRRRLIAWSIFSIAAIFYAYEYLLRIYPAIMTAELTRHFNINSVHLGHLAACYYYAYAIMQIPVGLLLDRFHPFRMLIFACLLCILSTCGFVMADNLWAAEISRFVMGAGSAFAFVGALKVATLWLPERYFVFAAGITSTFGLLTAMLGNLGLALIIQQQGWQVSLWLLVLIGAGIVLCMVPGFWLQSTPSTEQQRLSVTINAVTQHILPILRNPVMWLNGFIGCLFYLPLSVFAELWGPAYLQAAHHLSPVAAADAVANVFLGWAIGAPVIGWLMSRWQNYRRVLGLSALLTALLFVSLLTYHWNVGQIKILLLLIGLCNAGQIIILEIACKLNALAVAGTSIALTNMLVMLGGAVLQPAVGWLLDLQGASVSANIVVFSGTAYRNALMIVPAASFLVWGLTYFLPAIPAGNCFLDKMRRAE